MNPNGLPIKTQKKSIIFILLQLISAAALCAQVHISAGVMKMVPYQLTKQYTVQRDIAFSAYGHFSFGSSTARFVFQPEVMITLQNGMNAVPGIGFKNGVISMNAALAPSITGAVIDVPLLFGADMHFPRVTITSFIGPYLSVPLHGAIQSVQDIQQQRVYYLSGGITFGVRCAVALFAGVMALDLRCSRDFSEYALLSDPLNAAAYEPRSNICVSIGYEYRFK